MATTRKEARQRRHVRIRNKIQGTADRPRMSICFTGRNIHVQFVDDQQGVTLAAASTVEEALAKGAGVNRSNVLTATALGKVAAERALSRQIKTVIFDRGGSRYHGKVKALADAARQAGLKF